MQIDYTIANVSEEAVAVKVMLGTREVEALVPGLTVEAVSGSMGHTFRFTPEDMDAARALFAVGKKVTATFTETAE